jgi:thiol-disulfide isomerase/thioredoxin
LTGTDDPHSGRADHAAAEPRARPRRTLAVIGLAVGGLALVIGLSVVAFHSSASTTANTTTNPTNFDLPALSGTGRVRLADFRGRPTVVNFFASWCTECDAELPGFRAAVDTYRGRVNFIFVNANDPGDGKAMARAHDLPSQRVARDVGPPDGSDLYRAVGGDGGMPITVFYDAHDHIITRSFGAILGNDLKVAIRQAYGIS